ncbi:hypothetical protein NO1_0214 [Candidatus Termititenax aidoneus]|uniref:Uncharacterized protein n=1 Tax=Termititenax aidoneus TaxID=2218524 RepID=A0A388T938_TERA1|nr:hypothetical protein NO1_0214 [Candidatus Termititenax aidoneus]
MNLRKVILAAGILAAAATAGVLDTNDVKLNSTLGLGANPAAIAVNQERKIEGGAIVLNQLNQSDQVKNGSLPGLSFIKGKNVNSSSFGDATKFLTYTDTFAGNWFAIRYRYESNLYPNFQATISLPAILDPQQKSKADFYLKDALETTSLVWGRELTKGLNAGVELATNVYTSNTNLTFNKFAKDLLSMSNSKIYEQSQPYYTLTLGGIYDVAANQKISLSHKLSEERHVDTGDGKESTAGTDYNEALPNETGLAYIYQVNDALELAGVFKTFWGLTYEKYTNIESGDSNVETVAIAPVNSYGFAASYKVTNEWELQGYGNFLRNYKNSLTSGLTGPDEKGYDVTQLGANVQYSPSFLNGGTILLGSYMTKLVNEDKNDGKMFDITNTSLSYSHAF